MPLETFGFITDLNASNPVGATDQKSQGDDHIRGIKQTLLDSFGAIAGAVTLTHEQINEAAIKNEANTFTEPLTIANATARLFMQETDAGANEKLWRFEASGDVFSLSTVLDAGTFQTAVLRAARLAGAVTSVSLGVGVNQMALNATQGGAVTLYHGGAAKLDTRDDGIQLRGNGSPGLGGVQDSRVLLFQGDGTTPIGRMGFNASADLSIDSQNHGASVLLTAEDASGNVRTLFEGDPDGGVTLYHDGADRLFTLSDGMQLRTDVNTDTANNIIRFAYGNGTLRAFAGLVSADLKLENQVHGGHVILDAENTAGSGAVILDGDPDGATSIYHAGELSIQTNAFGPEFNGSDNNSIGGNVTSYMTLSTSAASDRGYVGFIGGPDLILRNVNHGGEVQLQAEDTPGVLRPLAYFDADAGFELYHTGGLYMQSRARTTTGAVSGAQVIDHDGTLRDVGLADFPVETINASVTLAAQHASQFIYYNSASAFTVTTEASSSFDFGVGKRTEVINNSTSNKTISAGAGTNLRRFDGTGQPTSASSITIAAGGWALIHRYDSSTYFVTGSGLS